MADKKLIMFDFDGVLVNTLAMCFAINSETDDTLKLTDYQALFSGNIIEMVQKSKFKGNPKFYDRYAEESRTVTIPEQMKKLVRDLSQTHMLSIISGSRSDSIREILLREDLLDCFSDVLGYDVDSSKVVRIKMLLNEYSADPAQTLFITDTSGDVYEAHECKVPSVAVTWGFQSKETLESSKPMVIVDTDADLTLEINRFFSATI